MKSSADASFKKEVKKNRNKTDIIMKILLLGRLTRCVKNVQIGVFWSVFSCIRTECGDLPRKYPHSVRIQENTDQKKPRIWTLFTQ